MIVTIGAVTLIPLLVLNRPRCAFKNFRWRWRVPVPHPVSLFPPHTRLSTQSGPPGFHQEKVQS